MKRFDKKMKTSNAADRFFANLVYSLPSALARLTEHI